MKIKNAIAILTASIIMNGSMAVVPILAEIQKTFSVVNSSEIQLIYTISSLFSLFAMFVAGILVHYFPKKNLLMTGIGIMFIGGILPSVFHQNLWVLYILSAVIGVGMGFLGVINSALPSDHFKGTEKTKILGIQATMVSIGGAVMSVVSGFIAVHANWSLSYLIFLICIPVFIVVFFTLSKDQVTPRNEAKKNGITGTLIYFVILNLFTSMCINVFHSNNAMFLEKTGLGDASVAGVVQFMFMIIGIPGGLCFGLCAKYLNRNLMGVISLFLATGMLFISFSHSLITIYAGAFLIGLGFSLKAAGVIHISTNMVPANSTALAIALTNAFGQIGNFISPMVVNPISRMVGGEPAKNFIISTVILFILSLLYIFINPIKKEKNALPRI
jgi:MFS family permease